MSRQRVLKRSLPCEFGGTSLFVSPDAQLKYLKLGREAFDEDLLNIAHRFLKPGFNVWDIGANVGVFTFAAASIVETGKILAVEADIWLAQLLYRSKLLNKDKEFDITVLAVAVSERIGLAQFIIAKRGRASNALEAVGGNKMMGGIRHVQTVPVLTLDILLRETFSPDFIKIDVEGAEALVLEGAVEILRDVRPIVYIEVNNKNRNHVTQLLNKYEYELLDGQSYKKIERCVSNTLAIPLS